MEMILLSMLNGILMLESKENNFQLKKQSKPKDKKETVLHD